MATSFALIDIGSKANSKDGDTLRTAFQKVNLNFSAIDAVIQQYIEDFFDTDNQLPTTIKPLTPDTNVLIESTGTGIISLNAPLISLNGETEINGNLQVAGEVNIVSTSTGIISLNAPLINLNGQTEITGNLEVAGEVKFDQLYGTVIDCGKF